MSVDELANSTRIEQRRTARASRVRFSFGLRTLLVSLTIIALIAGYFAWNVNLVERRRQLHLQCQGNDVFAILLWEDSPSGIKDLRELTIFQVFDGWQERATDPAASFIRDAPLDRGTLSWLRRWLGDRRVSNIFLTDPAQFAHYRAAFPEAQIVVDAAANAEISTWERHTGSLRSQLTRSP